MKIVQKNKSKKQTNKKNSVQKPKKEHVLIVAQEIKFARQLAGNDKKTRDRALKTLKKWLLHCFQKQYEFKENDFLRIWKGLFYAVWMSDKPLVQEELCENIASILDLFPEDQYKYALLMVKVGLKTLANEWYGIDHHRMDKCLMLVRRYLRGSLRCLARCDWSGRACKLYAKMLTGSDGILALKTPLYARNATSMILHIIDCYLEEIAKVSQGKIKADSFAELLRPFCAYICGGESPTLCAAARKLLTELLRQSELGLEYRERTRVWEKMGCPEGGPEALQLVSDDEDDDDEQQNGDGDGLDDDDDSSKPLDPRAGRVDVTLHPLPVPSAQIADMLADMVGRASSAAHRRAAICMRRFQKLSQSEYPLVVENIQVEPATPAMKPTAAAKSLQSLEKTLVSNSDDRAIRGLSRKHRKRLLAKSRSGLSIIEDIAAVKTTQNNAAGDWKVEDAEPPAKKTKKDSSNKENQAKKGEKRKLTQKKLKIGTKSNDRHPKVKMTEKEVQKSVNKMAAAQKSHVKGSPSAKSGPKLNGSKSAPKLNGSKSEPKLNGSKSEPKLNGSKSEPKHNGSKSEPKLERRQIIKNAPAIIKEKSKKPILELKKSEISSKKAKTPTVVSKKVKNFQKQLSPKDKSGSILTPKRVKFVLKNNSMQETIDYYKSVRQSPSIPFDSSKIPSKTNLKVSTPSPINPFFKKKKNRRC